MRNLAIDVKGLTKKFDKQVAVDHISLQVQEGAIFGFLGANGSGKTTTIRMLCGLLNPSSGEGSCLKYDIVKERDKIKRSIGYMPQKFSFYKGLTVQQNLQFVADIYQIPDAAKVIETIIKDLNLGFYRDKLAGGLSGGWQQSLALACCLVHSPKLLFLDEPTAGVDPKARKEFWDYLHELSRKSKITVLVTTHYMDEVEKCSDVAYINKGTLLYSGKTKDILTYSKIHTLVFEGEAEAQDQLLQAINQKYPHCLTSIINNTLRTSSKDLDTLKKIQKEYQNLDLKEVPPSFEEIFIGLMQ